MRHSPTASPDGQVDLSHHRETLFNKQNQAGGLVEASN